MTAPDGTTYRSVPSPVSWDTALFAGTPVGQWRLAAAALELAAAALELGPAAGEGSQRSVVVKRHCAPLANFQYPGVVGQPLILACRNAPKIGREKLAQVHVRLPLHSAR